LVLSKLHFELQVMPITTVVASIEISDQIQISSFFTMHKDTTCVRSLKQISPEGLKNNCKQMKGQHVIED